MADIGNLVKAARAMAAFIPGAAGVAGAIDVGERMVALIDGLLDGAPDTRTQAEMQAARRELAAAVGAKAERTADRFD